jgi:hypothetical protein
MSAPLLEEEFQFYNPQMATNSYHHPWQKDQKFKLSTPRHPYSQQNSEVKNPRSLNMIPEVMKMASDKRNQPRASPGEEYMLLRFGPF